MKEKNRNNLLNLAKRYFKSIDIPLWFKILNMVILIPILLFPFVFFTTIFFFDNPKNLFLTFLLFLAVNGYPVYLALLAFGNYKLYRRNNYLALIIPVLFLISMGIGVNYIALNVRETNKQTEESKKQQVDSGDLGLGFRKDKQHVYCQDTIVDYADPSTFEIINWLWEKDSKSYFFQGKLASYVDYTSFQYLQYNYAKDKNNVYYMDQIIKDADAKTFQHIEGSQDGKDKNSCYRRGEKVNCTVLENEE